MIDSALYKSKIEIIRRNLRYLRNQFGISQAQLADALDLSRQTLSALEKGSGRPTLKTIHSIADYFGVSIEAFFYDMGERFCVITCDVVDSRSVTNRGKLQRKIIEFNRSINRSYGSHLVTRFNITLGDEFQGVMRNFNKFLELYLDIRTGMLPYSVSMGVGIGQIETRLYKANSNKMDGPAFHYAREMVELGKRRKGHIYLKTGKIHDRVVNLLLEELNEKFEVLSAKQIQILHQYIKLNNQIQVADLMGVSQAYVSNVLKLVGYNRVKRIMDEIETLVERSGEEGEGR